MKVKISTKEKFHVLEINEEFLSANMTEEFENKLESFLEDGVKNVVLNLKDVQQIDEEIVSVLANASIFFTNSRASFVICQIQPNVNKLIKDSDAEDLLNITPSESEAWDIIQMEEIERELMQDEEP